MPVSARITRPQVGTAIATGAAPLPDLSGRLIGGYRLGARLGEGGMSTVYEAVHQTMGRNAAVKVLAPDLSREPEIVERFFNEARAVSIIAHPDLVDIYELGRLPDGTAYLIMEQLHGETLSQRRRRLAHLPLLMVLRLGRQIAAALRAVHDKGIVHRDLKPDNIVIVPDAEAEGGERAKILDFGIAKLAEEHRPRGAGRTLTGMVLGTPVYMSPEQCRGASQVTAKSDVYSLGIILYEALAGEPPFVAEGEGELLAAHIYEEPPALGEAAPEIPAPLRELVLAMLDKDPARRPTMAEVGEQLTGLGRRSPDSRRDAWGAPPTGPAGGGPFGRKEGSQEVPVISMPLASTPLAPMPLAAPPPTSPATPSRPPPSPPRPLPASPVLPQASTATPQASQAALPASVLPPTSTATPQASQAAPPASPVLPPTSPVLPPTSTATPRDAQTALPPALLRRAAWGRRLTLAGLLLGVAGAASALLLSGRPQGAATTRPPVTGQAPSAKQVPAPTPLPTPTPLIEQPRPAPKVRWLVETQPEGAEVIRVRDGAVLGTTPYQVEQEARAGAELVSLRRAGYKSKDLALDLSANVMVREGLVQVAQRPARKPRRTGDKGSAPIAAEPPTGPEPTVAPPGQRSKVQDFEAPPQDRAK